VPGLGANECVLSGKWCFAIREANVSCGETDSQDLGSPLHGIPPAFAGGHQCARSSKRAGGFIPRIALDQCRDPERYRTRVPFCPHSSPEQDCLERVRKANGGQRKTGRKSAIRGPASPRQAGVSEEAPTTYTDCLGP